MDKVFTVGFAINGEVRIAAATKDDAYQHVMEMTQRELAEHGELEVFAPETDEEIAEAWAAFEAKIVARSKRNANAKTD